MNPATATLPLVANRWATFVYVIAFQGLNLTGIGMDAAIRVVRDGTGVPLISLAGAPDATSQGIFLLSEGNEDVDFGERIGVLTVPVSYVQLWIDDTTLNALPFPAERGEDLDLFWDLRIFTSATDKYRAVEGTFTVHAGVTGSS